MSSARKHVWLAHRRVRGRGRARVRRVRIRARFSS